MNQKKYHLVVTGGTFDHFHAGHRSLLSKAFAVSQKVIIGITEDNYSKGKTLSSQIESYSFRLKSVRSFLQELGCKEDDYSLIIISDVYGPTLENKEIEAIIVGPRTYNGALEVNRKRKSLKLNELPIIEADFIRSSDGEYISSTRIREGSINRDGLLYMDLFKKTVKVGDRFKDFLRQIHGEIISNGEVVKLLKKIIRDNQNQDNFIIWVGDLVGEIFINNNLSFDWGFFDLQTERRVKDTLKFLCEDQKTLRLKNRAGEINAGLVKELRFIKEQKKEKNLLYVQGEEDLVAVPLILLMPLGSKIFYGLRGKGLIMINVTEEKKEEVKDFLIINSKRVL